MPAQVFREMTGPGLKRERFNPKMPKKNRRGERTRSLSRRHAVMPGRPE